MRKSGSSGHIALPILVNCPVSIRFHCPFERNWVPSVGAQLLMTKECNSMCPNHATLHTLTHAGVVQAALHRAQAICVDPHKCCTAPSLRHVALSGLSQCGVEYAFFQIGGIPFTTPQRLYQHVTYRLSESARVLQQHHEGENQ